MGGKVPKEQSFSEKIKEKLINFKALHKSGPLEDSQELIFKSQFKMVEFRIHEGLLSSESQSLTLDDSFLVICRSQPMLELTILESFSRTLHILKFDSVSVFQEITSHLFLSKRPKWTFSTSCQECFKDFSLFRRCHHCRGCGKSICNDCSSYCRLDIYGYITLQRVCEDCISRSSSQVETISDLRRTNFNSSVHENLYNLGYNQSLIEISK
jgi:hypothetical protein